jgi:Ca2+:H+ antiporter
MLWCAFTVVRHADAVAAHLGEPYGTLVLTISVITIEVLLMTSIVLHGDNNPTLARDAMFATLMIVLNGMIGTALLMGGCAIGSRNTISKGRAPFSWSSPRSPYLR